MSLTPREALDLFASDDLIGVGMEAMAVRNKKTDPRVVTYQFDRNINYTNFCTEYCSFCAFYRPLGARNWRDVSRPSEALRVMPRRCRDRA